MTMTSKVFATDPCPAIPESFIDPTRILKLAREIKSSAGASEVAVAEPAETMAEPEDGAEIDTDWRPKPLLQTMVASRRVWDKFRDVLAEAARARGFAAAKRKAFAADGAAVNWSTHKLGDRVERRPGQHPHGTRRQQLVLSPREQR